MVNMFRCVTMKQSLGSCDIKNISVFNHVKIFYHNSSPKKSTDFIIANFLELDHEKMLNHETKKNYCITELWKIFATEAVWKVFVTLVGAVVSRLSSADVPWSLPALILPRPDMMTAVLQCHQWSQVTVTIRCCQHQDLVYTEHCWWSRLRWGAWQVVASSGR